MTSRSGLQIRPSGEVRTCTDSSEPSIQAAVNIPLTGSADRIGNRAGVLVRTWGGPAERPPGATRRTDRAPLEILGSVSSAMPLGPPAMRGWSARVMRRVVHCEASLTLPLPVHSRTVIVPEESENAAIGRVPSSPRRP